MQGFEARVTAPAHLNRIIFEILGSAIFAYLIYRSSIRMVEGVLLLALLVIGLVREAYVSLRGTDVRLSVEDLNFRTVGHSPGGYIQGEVAREDVLRLEYRAASGGEDAEHPCGLYLEYNSDSPLATSICLLPHIDDQQANQVIDALRLRFPDFDRFMSQRPPKTDLVLLNLQR